MKKIFTFLVILLTSMSFGQTLIPRCDFNSLLTTNDYVVISGTYQETKIYKVENPSFVLTSKDNNLIGGLKILPIPSSTNSFISIQILRKIKMLRFSIT